MNDDLLFYYEQELRYVRKALNDSYRRGNPDAASHLGVGADRYQDPFVRELIDGFALLNARTSYKLDSVFADIQANFFQSLYPHYFRPLPSMAVVQFTLDAAGAAQPLGQQLYGSRQKEQLPTELYTFVEGEQCRYALPASLRVLPLDITEAKFLVPPFPVSEGSSNTALAALQLKVASLNQSMPLSEMPLASEGLRIFFKEVSDDSHELFELLCRHLQGVGIYDSESSKLIAELPAEALRPVGLDQELSVLDYPKRSFPGYGLLTELFAYRSRFSFFRLDFGKHDLPPAVDVYFFLDNQVSARLQQHVGNKNILVNCAPVINLFKSGTIAIELDHSSIDYPLLVDKDRIWAHEIYSVDEVVLKDKVSGDNSELHPIYKQLPGDPITDSTLVYGTRREYAEREALSEEAGSDLFLSVTRLDGKYETTPQEAILEVQATLLNRNLPNQIGANPDFSLGSGVTGMEVNCVTAPTRTARPRDLVKDQWRLASHLSLNHLTLSDVENVKRLLTIYDYLGNDLDRRERNSLQEITSDPLVEQIFSNGRTTFVRGVSIGLKISEQGLPAGRAYLLAAVLAKFFAMYCTMNSVVQTSANIGGESVALPWTVHGARPII